MTSSLDMIRGRSNVVTLTNKSGGPLVAGDVCVIDTANDEAATTTTSAASVLKVYIAAESIADNATGKFYSAGFCPLVTPSASVTRGRYLFTHTVAKQAAESATYGAGAFGVILKSGTTPSVWLFGSTAQGSGGGVVRSGATTDGHLAVWNGSSADSLKNGGVGAGVQIAQVVLGADAADITFSSIPATYTNLRLDFQGRGTKSAAYTELRMQFNGDTAGNYNQERLSVSGTSSFTVAEGIGAAYLLLGYIAAASATAGAAGSATTNIQNYSRTTFWKQITSHCTVTLATTTTNHWIQLVSGMWAATTAINAIKLTPDANNFLAGSVATLYGLI